MKIYAVLIKFSTGFFKESDNSILNFYGIVKSQRIFELSREFHSTRHHFLLQSYNHLKVKFWHREPIKTKLKQNIRLENLRTSPPLWVIFHEQCFLHPGIQGLNAVARRAESLRAWDNPISRDHN